MPLKFYIPLALALFISDIQLAAAEYRPSVEAKPLQLALSSFSERMDLSALADEKRDAAISGIKDLLISGPAEKRPVLLFRLAELQFEKSRSTFNKEYQKFEAAFQDFVDSGRKTTEPELKNFTLESDRQKDLALLTYNELLTKYPKYQRLDEVYYSLGAAFFDSGQKKQAAERFSDLIREFPQSQFLQDAYLGLGEYYFDAREIPKATIAYRKAYELGVQSQKTSSYVYALYKSAWCDFNEQRFSDSLNKLKQVVSLSREAASRQEKQGGFKDAVQLGLEALNDTVRAFARLSDVDGAIAYWSQNAPEKVAELTEKMGMALLGNGSYKEASQTFDALLNKFGTDSKKPQWRSQKLFALKELDDRSALVAEAQRACEECETNPGHPDACNPVENRIRELATHFHQHANKRKNLNDLKDAASLYRLYTKTFKSSPERTRMRFYLAEVEWDLENYRDAAVAYRSVREQETAGEFFEKSLVAELLAWDKLLPKSPSKELSEAEKGWIAVADEMRSLSDEHRLSAENESKVSDISFKASTLYLAHDKFENAQNGFNHIIRRWPRAPVAAKSVEILLDRLETTKDYHGLIAFTQSLKQNSDLLRDAKLVSRIELYEEAAYFNQAMDGFSKAENGRWSDVANSFVEFAKRYPKSDKQGIAHYNAALAQVRASQLKLAISQAKLASVSSSDAKIRRDATLLLADLYEKTADFRNAAEAYQDFVTQNKKDEKAADALIKAAALMAITGNTAGAVSNYERLLKDFPEKGSDENLSIEAARLHETLGKTADAAKLLQSAKLKGSLKAQVALAKMQSRLGRQKETAEACKRVSSLAREGEGPAFCAFQMLLDKEDAYKKLSLKVRVSQLKSRIEQKRIMMEELAKQYLEIPQFKDAEWGLAAMVEAADVLQSFAQALREIPAPKELNEEGLEVFRAQIEEIVFPVQERAIALAEEATAKAFELGIYTKSLNKGLAMLQQGTPTGSNDKQLFYAFGEVVPENADQQKLTAEREDILEKISLHPDDVNLKLRLANALARESKYAQAEWILDGLTESGIEDPNLWNLKGLIKLKTDSPSVALTFFEKASQSKEPVIDAMLNLAALSSQYKDETRAKKMRDNIASKKEAT